MPESMCKQPFSEGLSHLHGLFHWIVLACHPPKRTKKTKPLKEMGYPVPSIHDIDEMP